MIRTFTFDRTATGLLFVVIALIACFTPAQNDTWWHLRAGEQTWLSGAVQFRDTFSYTAAGAYWPNQEWLGEVVLYLLYSAGGLALMTAAAALAIVVSWIAIWRVSPGGALPRLTLCAMAVMVSSREWSLRPKVFTLAFLAAMVTLIVRKRYRWLPLLFVLWANVHAGVMLGVAAVTAASAAVVINERRLRTPLVPLSAACVLATAVTPLGFKLWIEIAASMARIRQYPIDEWRPPQLIEPVFLPFWIVAAVLIALTARAVASRRETARAPIVWAALALLPLAAGASRNVAPAMLAAVPAVMTLAVGDPELARLLGIIGSRRRRERPWINAAALAGTALAALVMVADAWTSRSPRLAWDPVPAQAMQAVSRCSGPLYNRYDEGGFLIWFAPRQKVFIDGRQDPFPPSLVHEHIAVEQSGRYADLFARYDIRCAFLPTASPVARNLASDGWTKQYADPNWEVLVRP